MAEKLWKVGNHGWSPPHLPQQPLTALPRAGKGRVAVVEHPHCGGGS